jgi:serine/threonine-protein kinase
MNAPSSTRFSTQLNAQPLPPDTTLQNGAFGLCEVLGRGGFGITYRARDVRQNREVAIKELFTGGCVRRGKRVEMVEENRRASFDNTKARFQEQARVLTQLRHPNIVRVSGFFHENDTAYLVMELLVGRTLLDIVSERGALPEAEALRFLEPLSDALEAIHRLGLLHLDIKPENVVVTETSHVVLMDFDLIQKLHRDEELQTRPLDAPSHCGTPGYAPVEQYSISTRFSPATDIYALGATLHHLVTGKAPLPALERAHHDELQFPDSCRESVGAAIEKSLQIAVEKRPQSVRAFRELLHSSSADTSFVHATSVDTAHAVSATTTATNNFAAASVSSPTSVPNAPFSPTTQNASSAASSSTRSSVHDTNLVWRVRVEGAAVQSLQWPTTCPCCGEVADDVLEIGRGARTWRVPHCSTCAFHADSSRTANFVGAWGLFGGLLIALVGFMIRDLFLGPVGMLIYFSAMGYGGLKSISADALRKPECVEKKASLHCREAGIRHLVFEFHRRDYADEIRQLNGAFWG